MNRYACLAAAAAGLALLATPLTAQEKTTAGTLTLFEGQKYNKDYYRVDQDRPALQHDFLVGSVEIFPGDVWELCDKPRYKGNCLTLSASEADIGKAVIKSARLVKPKQ